MSERKPTKEGIGGKAWEMLSLASPTETTFHTCMSCWILWVPNAHPFWSWYVVTVVHLRDDPSLGKAQKAYAEAEYELIIYAIDPAQCPPPLDRTSAVRPLIPIDQVVQFDGTGDDGAAKLAEAAVDMILKGMFSPDQDYRRMWRDWVPMIANEIRYINENGGPDR